MRALPESSVPGWKLLTPAGCFVDEGQRDSSFRSREHGRASLRQLHHARPHHSRGRQMLTGQAEQQRRGIVLHRTCEQELVQLLPLQRLRWLLLVQADVGHGVGDVVAVVHIVLH